MKNVEALKKMIEKSRDEVESKENFWVTMHQSAKYHKRAETVDEAMLLLLENQARLISRIENLEACLDILLNNLKNKGE